MTRKTQISRRASYGLPGWLGFLWLVTAPALAVEGVLSDVSIAPTDESVLLEFKLDDASNIANFDLVIMYDSAILSNPEVALGDAIPSFVMEVSTDTPGRIGIGAFSQDAIPGGTKEVILFALRFRIDSGFTGETTVEIAEFLLNDANFNRVRATKKNGTITVRPVEGFIRDMEISAGEEVEVDILLSDASDVGNFDVKLAYDPQIFTVTALSFGEDLSDFTTQTNIETAGQVIVGGFANADAVPKGSFNFVLFSVTFSVSENASGETPIRFKELLLNDSGFQPIPTTIKAGTIRIIPTKKQFNLTIPEGIALIHIPLKVTEVDGQAMEIETIGDLYDALGGAENVNLIITHDASAGVWLSYLSNAGKGTAADQRVTDDLGIITVMKNPVTLQLQGEALGIDGIGQIALNAGTNLVGVPLMDARLKRVSDLLSLQGIKDNAAAIIVSDSGEFKVVAQPGDDGDIPITGGGAFIITARRASVAEITGEAWENLSGSAAPPIKVVWHKVDASTPVLAVHGAVVDKGTGLVKARFRVTVKNLSTGTTLSTLSGHDTSTGSYSVTFVDAISSRVAWSGDMLEITAETSNPRIGVQPLRHIVSTDDVNASQIRLPDLIAYEIPAKTELLPNYPNPFNPETWIPYQLAKEADVTIEIYNLLGQRVRKIDLGFQPTGYYITKEKAAYWDGRIETGERIASGVYFYHIRAGKYSETRKMLVVK